MNASNIIAVKEALETEPESLLDVMEEGLSLCATSLWYYYVIAVMVLINVAAAWAAWTYTAMWFSVLVLASAVINVPHIILCAIAPGFAFRVQMAMGRYLWFATRPVVRFFYRMFWGKEDANGFIEVIDIWHRTMAGKD